MPKKPKKPLPVDNFPNRFRSFLRAFLGAKTLVQTILKNIAPNH
jgi:hypothetical protein